MEQKVIDLGPSAMGAAEEFISRRMTSSHFYERMSELDPRKRIKHELIRPLLSQQPAHETDACFDFLTPELRTRFGVADSKAVSKHAYDPYAIRIINRHKAGLVLDCGAGQRDEYLSNVVNLEIASFPSTDVLAVAEQLPFRDASFDGVLCLAVLEHVKDPFKAAREIARVLKPGGDLYCVVPFLQPEHGYPNHYYNMTRQGLSNLFDGLLSIKETLMLASGLPIWTLSSMLNIWVAGLKGKTREQFFRLRVMDLLEDPLKQLNRDYVTQLPLNTNFELATTTGILAKKPV